MTEPIVETTIKNAVLDNNFYITHANIPSESNDLIVDLKGYVMGAMASNLWNDIFGYEFGHIYDIANGIGYVDAMAGTAFRNLNCNCVGGWMFQICSNVDPTIDPATVTFDCNLFAPKTIFSITCNLVNSDVPIVAPIIGASNIYIQREPVVTSNVVQGWIQNHTHTKAQITDFDHTHLWEHITNPPLTFPPAAHTHDYSQITNSNHFHTKSEITDFAHTHLWEHITNPPLTFPPAAHTHDYSQITNSNHFHTKSEITDFAHTHLWEHITNPPLTFPPDSHTHDYSEITNSNHRHPWSEIDEQPVFAQLNAIGNVFNGVTLYQSINTPERLFLNDHYVSLNGSFTGETGTPMVGTLAVRLPRDPIVNGVYSGDFNVGVNDTFPSIYVTNYHPGEIGQVADFSAAIQINVTDQSAYDGARPKIVFTREKVVNYLPVAGQPTDDHGKCEMAWIKTTSGGALEVNQRMAAKNLHNTTLSGVVTDDYLTNKGYLTTADLSSYTTDAELTTALANYLPLTGGTVTGTVNSTTLQIGGTTIPKGYEFDQLDSISTDRSANNWTVNWTGHRTGQTGCYTTPLNDEDCSGCFMRWTVPEGMKSFYIQLLNWHNCRYFDIYGETVNGHQHFLKRVNHYQAIQDSGIQDGTYNAIIYTSINCDFYKKILVKGVKGRIHLTGVFGWSRQRATDNDVGLIHYDNIAFNPVGKYSDFDVVSGWNSTGVEFVGSWQTNWKPTTDNPVAGFHSTIQNDETSSDYAQVIVPTGMKTCHIQYLCWTNARYFDIQGYRNSRWNHIMRVNTYQNVSNTADSLWHDSLLWTSVFCGNFTHIRVVARKGRVHIGMLGWTKEVGRTAPANGMISWDNVYSKPSFYSAADLPGTATWATNTWLKSVDAVERVWFGNGDCTYIRGRPNGDGVSIEFRNSADGAILKSYNNGNLWINNTLTVPTISATTIGATTIDVATLKRNGYDVPKCYGFDDTVAGGAYHSSGGTWTVGYGSSWDPGYNYGSYVFNSEADDTESTSTWIQYTIPTAMVNGTAFLTHLPWTNCRYFEIWGVRSNGAIVFITRVNNYHPHNGDSGGHHNGLNNVPIFLAGRFTHIRIYPRVGRVHIMGIGFTHDRAHSSSYGGHTGYISWDNIYSKPNLLTPSLVGNITGFDTWSGTGSGGLSFSGSWVSGWTATNDNPVDGFYSSVSGDTTSSDWAQIEKPANMKTCHVQYLCWTNCRYFDIGGYRSGRWFHIMRVNTYQAISNYGTSDYHDGLAWASFACDNFSHVRFVASKGRCYIGMVGWTKEKGRTSPANGMISWDNVFSKPLSATWATGDWIRSSDDYERVYFGSAGTTYIRGHTTTVVEFRNTIDTHVAFINDDGYMWVRNYLGQGSDRRYKTDIKKITGALSAIEKLEGVSFKRIGSEKDGTRLGLIAQDVQQVIPEVVRAKQDDGYLALEYTGLIPVLIEAVKELSKKCKSLQDQIDQIKNVTV